MARRKSESGFADHHRIDDGGQGHLGKVKPGQLGHVGAGNKITNCPKVLPVGLELHLGSFDLCSSLALCLAELGRGVLPHLFFISSVRIRGDEVIHCAGLAS